MPRDAIATAAPAVLATFGFWTKKATRTVVLHTCHAALPLTLNHGASRDIELALESGMR
jgi:hypothetical protein